MWGQGYIWRARHRLILRAGSVMAHLKVRNLDGSGLIREERDAWG
jgi:hypothetical protein